jgi:putative nucleotidyltransferase with HDIG domain
VGKAIRQIEVSGLRVGMYVSQLDRPWLETPFLFQGFYIRSESEIEDIRRYCQFVEIDIDESDPAIRRYLTAANDAESQTAANSAGKRDGWWQRLLRFFGLGNRHSTTERRFTYEDTVTTAEELIVAKSLHSGALDKIVDVLEGIQNGGTIEMPKLEVITGELVDSVLRNGTAMALLARMQEKDEYISHHSLESSIFALVFGRHLGLDRESLQAVGLGALLLDVGKTRIPLKLLNKTEPLTDVELAYIRTHVEKGVEILREGGTVDSRVIDMVATHHERYDGSGYPKGWKGNQIPVFGRIAGIVDSYTAMISKRPYADAMSSFDAMREFKAQADIQFQAEMVEQFIQAIGIFPPGTLVELNTGEIGVVLKENIESRLQPEVAVLRDTNKASIHEVRIIDLGEQQGTTPSIWIERGVEPGTYDIDPRDYFL